MAIPRYFSKSACILLGAAPGMDFRSFGAHAIVAIDGTAIAKFANSMGVSIFIFCSLRNNMEVTTGMQLLAAGSANIFAFHGGRREATVRGRQRGITSSNTSTNKVGRRCRHRRRRRRGDIKPRGMGVGTVPFFLLGTGVDARSSFGALAFGTLARGTV